MNTPFTAAPSVVCSQVIPVLMQVLTPAEMLHQTMGHASASAIRRIIKHKAIEGLTIGTPKGIDKVGGINCPACAIGKFAKLPSTNPIPPQHKPTAPLQECQVDLLGPFRIGRRKGLYHYVLVIVDLFTKYTWVYFLETKDEAPAYIKHHIEKIERQFEKKQLKLVFLHSDGGGEFLNNELDSFLTERGITHTVAPPHTANMNCYVERKNRHHLEVTRTIIIHAKLPSLFWVQAFIYANYLINRMVPRDKVGLSPFQRLYQYKPKLSHMKIFGSDCIVYLRKEERDHKLSPSGMRGIYLGWYDSYHCHMVYSPETGNVFGTKHVKVINGSFTVPVKGTSSELKQLYQETLELSNGNDDFKIITNAIPPREAEAESRAPTEETDPETIIATLDIDLPIINNLDELNVPLLPTTNGISELNLSNSTGSDTPLRGANDDGTDPISNNNDDSFEIKYDDEDYKDTLASDNISNGVASNNAEVRGADNDESFSFLYPYQSWPEVISTDSSSGIPQKPTKPMSAIQTQATPSSLRNLQPPAIQSTLRNLQSPQKYQSAPHRNISTSSTTTNRNVSTSSTTGTRPYLPRKVKASKPVHTTLKLVSQQVNAEMHSNTKIPVMVLRCENGTVRKQVIGVFVNSLRQKATIIRNEVIDWHTICVYAMNGVYIGDKKKEVHVGDQKVVVPRNVKEILKLPIAEQEAWLKSAKQEFKAQIDNDVWILIPITDVPLGRTPIRCRWIFRIKFNADGTIEKYKARIVAKGYEQIFGEDYHETYAPTVRYKSLKMVLALTCMHNLELKQIDYTTAFLNAQMKEDIYMEQPEGFIQPPPNGSTNRNERMVCKLVKSLYGTKQAPRNWHLLVDKAMKNLGFIPIVSDSCVYIKASSTNRMILVSLYVDDKVIAFHKEDEAEWNTIKNKLMAQFKIEDKGDCQWVLQMEVIRDRKNGTMFISQQKYVVDKLREYNIPFGDAVLRPCTNPVTTQAIQEADLEGKIIQCNEKGKQRYQSIIGSLLYVALNTRIDIAFITNRLSSFNNNPQPHHIAAAERVLSYLGSTRNLALKYTGTPAGETPTDTKMMVRAYSDSDWGGCQDTRRSTTGTIVLMNDNVIHWASTRQHTVATSSAEAEYMALSDTTKDLKWFNSWLRELLVVTPKEFDLMKPNIVHVDNTAAIAMSNRDAAHSRTKHIDIRHHFVREQVENGEISIKWTPTTEQLADLLTKRLATTVFSGLVNQLLSKVPLLADIPVSIPLVNK